MLFSRMTPEGRKRMRLALKWREEGRTLEWIGRKLKVTRERVRQLQKLAEYERARR